MDEPASHDPDSPTAPARNRIIQAFLALLAEQSFETIELGAVAARADVTLSELRGSFGSTLAILAAYVKDVDRAVLAASVEDMADEPPRERLFDVLMRRIETLEPHKAAIRSLSRSALRNPGLAVAINATAVQSQQWMLTAANLPASGPSGLVRAQGLAVMFASVLRIWLDDHDPGHARTMAALDRALARGQRWAGLLDNLFSIPERLCRARPRRRRHDAPETETTAAA